MSSKVVPFKPASVDLRSKVRPVKHRVALTAVQEEATGIILMPSNANQVHRLGRVAAIGDTVQIGVAVDDIVIYQVNKMFELSVTHFVGEGDQRQPVMIMHQGDTFAKLDSPQITLENFHVLGDWILVRDIKIDMIGGLYLPDTAIPPPEFEVVQIGNLLPSSEDPVLAGLKVGDKVYVDKSRANQIRLEGKLFWYVLKQGIHGVRPA
jgi:co-chaperonin GroES (HSP10)